MRDPVDVIEAAYRSDLSDRAWVAGLVEAARPLVDDGRGVFGGLYDARDVRHFRMSSMVGSGILMQGWVGLLGVAARSVPPAQIQAVFRDSTCATLSESLGEEFLRTNPLARRVARFGIHDSLGINGADPSGRGVVLCVPLRKMAAADPSTVEVWSRVAAHLAAGLRLRDVGRAGDSRPRRGAQALADAEAILDPAGRLHHAVGEATSQDARAALRLAVVTQDRARGRLRRQDPVEAVTAWTALVDGRWSVIDHFDSDGRRFIIARRNESLPRLCKPLTIRERQVLGYVVMGHSNKLIAYCMGLATSTVASHISSASRKLGCDSRVELIRRFLERQEARA